MGELFWLIIGVFVGVPLGMLFYGAIIALSLAHGRLPKSLANVGFTLPAQYKNGIGIKR